MTTKELLAFHQEVSDKARSIMAMKNHDYAGADGETPFKNFEMAEALGICTTEQAFLVRIVDKLMRVITFTNSGTLLVKDESVTDSLAYDIPNYCKLMAAYLKHKSTHEVKTNRKVTEIIRDANKTRDIEYAKSLTNTDTNEPLKGFIEQHIHPKGSNPS